MNAQVLKAESEVRMIWCRGCGQPHEEPACGPREWLAKVKYKDWRFRLAPDLSWLQVAFGAAADEQRGRKWRLSTHMTKSEVIQTAFKAVLTAEEHETREAFLYRGHAIFRPHYNVDALAELCHQSAADRRDSTSAV